MPFSYTRRSIIFSVTISSKRRCISSWTASNHDIAESALILSSDSKKSSNTMETRRNSPSMQENLILTIVSLHDDDGPSYTSGSVPIPVFPREGNNLERENRHRISSPEDSMNRSVNESLHRETVPFVSVTEWSTSRILLAITGQPGYGEPNERVYRPGLSYHRVPGDTSPGIPGGTEDLHLHSTFSTGECENPCGGTSTMFPCYGYEISGSLTVPYLLDCLFDKDP